MRSKTLAEDFHGTIEQNYIPISCLFELTYRCNLRCLHCYISKSKMQELTLQRIFAVLAQLKAAGCLFLALSGGEIFLRKDFFAIANRARDLNFALRLLTNATLIDESIAKKIKPLLPVSVEVSLYGLKDAHDRITGVKGSFEKTVHAIRLLSERGVKVVAKTVIMRQNFADFMRLSAFVKDNLKVDFLGFEGANMISPCDNGNKKPLQYRLSDAQMKEYMRLEAEYIVSRGIKNISLQQEEGESLCRSGIATCNITAYGELNPCVQIKLKKDNNLCDNTFFEIWENHDDFVKLRALKHRDKVDCLDCSVKPFCFNCSGISWLETGSLLSKLPEACRQAKMRQKAYEKVMAVS
jgi:radical SAM protein with 4Fe4S-binding SPASM domain